MLSVYPKRNRVIHTFSEKSTHNLSEINNESIDSGNSEYLFVEPFLDNEISDELMRFYGVAYDQWKKWATNENENWYRFEGMFEVMNLWKKITTSGHNISEYFVNRGYKNIAIYGKGKIGAHLEQELANSNVYVSFFIDRDEKKRDKAHCFLPVDDLPKCDVIVITVTGYIVPIVKLLHEKNNCDIKSILDVVNDR